MSNDDRLTTERIRRVVLMHGRLSISPEQLLDSTDLYQAGLTSLATVGMMLALEDEFGIEFPDGMLGRRTFASIQSIADAIARLSRR